MTRETDTDNLNVDAYWAWVKSEPLANPCVDMENVGQPDGSADYWERLLKAGKSAVEMRKDEQEWKGRKS
jgi:hypothetical protein